MRILACIALLSGCNFFTAELEDGAPVRVLSGPERSVAYGTGVVGLPPGTCGAVGALIVGGFEEGGSNAGARLYLVTFGKTGASTRAPINDFNSNLPAGDHVVALRMGTARDGVEVPIHVQTEEGGIFEVNLDSDCDGTRDEICDDVCTPLDAKTTAPPLPKDLMGDVAAIDLLGDGDPVTVTGSSGEIAATATGGALSREGEILVPEGAEGGGLGGSVTGMLFGAADTATEELVVGGASRVLVYFRTGLTAGAKFDCDPREGAPADVACD